MLKSKSMVFNFFGVNTYIIWDETSEGVIVDPGCTNSEEISVLESFLAENKLTIKMVLLTHAHFDHTYAVKYLSEKYGCKVYLNKADKVYIKEYAELAKMFDLNIPDTSYESEDAVEGLTLHFGNTDFYVIETPGHTPGCVCYHFEKDKVLISGDTLFSGCIGRTDLLGGDYDKMIVGIMEKLMILDGDTALLPGHGGPSNIGYERTHNPFLQPFNEPEEKINEE